MKTSTAAFLLIALVPAAPRSWADAPAKPAATPLAQVAFTRPTQVVLTNRENANVSDEQLVCEGMIHGYLTLPERVSGVHALDGRWVKPNGETQENTHVTLHIDAPGRRTAHVWMRFDGRDGGLLSGTQNAPEANSPFNGVWQLALTWDGKPLALSKFKVKC